MRPLASLIAVFVLIVLSTGCTDRNNANAIPAKGLDPAPDSSLTAASAPGRKVFDTNKCARCHRIDEPGMPPGKGKAPNLTHVGAKRSAEWITEHVRDPKTHDGKMPAYPEAKINNDDLKALAEYLASLK